MMERKEKERGERKKRERREGGMEGKKKRKLTYIVIEYKDRQEAIGMIPRKLQGGVSCDWLRCKLHR